MSERKIQVWTNLRELALPVLLSTAAAGNCAHSCYLDRSWDLIISSNLDYIKPDKQSLSRAGSAWLTGVYCGKNHAKKLRDWGSCSSRDEHRALCKLELELNLIKSICFTCTAEQLSSAVGNCTHSYIGKVCCLQLVRADCIGLHPLALPRPQRARGIAQAVLYWPHQ